MNNKQKRRQLRLKLKKLEPQVKELKEAIGGCEGCCECQHSYMALDVLNREIKSIEEQIKELV